MTCVVFMDEKNYWVGFNLIQGISAAGMRSWPQHFDEVVCDYASGTSSYAANFPPHRRIISGLSLAFVVVQAGGTSGALTAAEFAAEYGREVSADPGSILAPQSKGTNKLIQPGAVPLLSINDLMQALDLNCMREHKAATRVVPADEIEARLMKVPGLQSSHVERIRNQPELPVENIPATLTLMELKGMAPQAGGMMSYVAVCEEQSDFSV